MVPGYYIVAGFTAANASTPTEVKTNEDNGNPQRMIKLNGMIWTGKT